MAQITSVTSEALQASIRRLLPSQQGFGEDLQASNVITPIIDLTPTAEGSSVPQMLQTALAFGSQDTFITVNTNDVIASTAGFYRVLGTSCIFSTSSLVRTCTIFINDSSGTNKNLYVHRVDAATGDYPTALSFDFAL